MSNKYIPNFEPLDEEERELEHLDATSAYSKEVQTNILEPYRAAPRKNVSMRLAESTIAGLRAQAEADGIPYQTLASMVLQKYVRGAYLERDAVKEVVAALNTELQTQPGAK